MQCLSRLNIGFGAGMGRLQKRWGVRYLQRSCSTPCSSSPSPSFIPAGGIPFLVHGQRCAHCWMHHETIPSRASLSQRPHCTLHKGNTPVHDFSPGTHVYKTQIALGQAPSCKISLTSHPPWLTQHWL